MLKKALGNIFPPIALISAFITFLSYSWVLPPQAATNILFWGSQITIISYFIHKDLRNTVVTLLALAIFLPLTNIKNVLLSLLLATTLTLNAIKGKSTWHALPLAIMPVFLLKERSTIFLLLLLIVTTAVITRSFHSKPFDIPSLLLAVIFSSLFTNVLSPRFLLLVSLLVIILLRPKVDKYLISWISLPAATIDPLIPITCAIPTILSEIEKRKKEYLLIGIAVSVAIIGKNDYSFPSFGLETFIIIAVLLKIIHTSNLLNAAYFTILSVVTFLTPDFKEFVALSLIASLHTFSFPYKIFYYSAPPIITALSFPFFRSTPLDPLHLIAKWKTVKELSRTTLKPGEKVETAADHKVDRVIITSYLENAGDLQFGTKVLNITITSETNTQQFNLLNGIHTADWSYPLRISSDFLYNIHPYKNFEYVKIYRTEFKLNGVFENPTIKLTVPENLHTPLKVSIVATVIGKGIW